MKIIRGDFTSNKDRMLHLFKNHWEEIGMYGSDHLDLDVNVEYYESLDKQKRFLGIGLENDTNSMIGYMSISIYGHPHHKSVIFAYVDCLYIKPEYRDSHTWIWMKRMFEFAEKILKEEYNVTYIQSSSSVKKDLTKLMERMDYTESEKVFLKRIK